MQKNNKGTARLVLAMMLLLPVVYTLAQPADSTETLHLRDLIANASVKNRNIQLARLDEQIATSNYRQTQAVFLPDLNFSYNVLTTNNPLNAFGFKLEQQSITQQAFNPDLLNHPPGTTDFASSLSLQQPVINMDLFYLRKTALKQIQLYRYKTQRTLEMIVFEAAQAYLQLGLTYDQQKVLQESLLTTQAIYKFTSDRYSQGLLQKSDLLNVEVQLKTIESALAETRSNIRNASDYISLLMEKPMGTVYRVDSADSPAVQSPLPDSISSERADFKAMQTAIDSYDLMIRSSKMSYLPKLNAFGNYQLHDNAMLGFGSGSYFAGIGLSWDIFKGTATRNKIITQKLEQRKLREDLDNTLEENREDFNKTNRQLQDAVVKINQQRTAIDQATEALRILENRYQQGLVTTTDVLMAQTQLSQQKLAYAQAVFARNSARAYLQFLTASTDPSSN